MTAPDLNDRQRVTLAIVATAGRAGYSARKGEPSLMALARRMLVDREHCRKDERNYRWVATSEGRRQYATLKAAGHV